MPDETKLPQSVNYDFIKTNQFRVVHADGAFFAVTPSGGLTINFFTERQPIPRRVVHKVNPDGSIGDEIVDQRVTRDALIRDAEVVVTMTMDTAKRITASLQDIITKLETAATAQKAIK